MLPDISMIKNHLTVSKDRSHVSRKHRRKTYHTVVCYLRFCCFAVCLSIFSGCSSPPVKMDLNTFLEDPEEYAGKFVIITATIKDLFDDPDSYLYHKVEVSGFVEYRESWVGPYWNFTLKEKPEGEISLSCYENRYRPDVWIWPLNAVRQAAHYKKELTVVGTFHKRMTLELDWIDYGGQQIYTDFLPPVSP